MKKSRKIHEKSFENPEESEQSGTGGGILRITVEEAKDLCKAQERIFAKGKAKEGILAPRYVLALFFSQALKSVLSTIAT